MHNWDIDLALTYHEETKHSYDSVYRSHHFLDWDNQPRSFKLYAQLAPQPLPETLPVSDVPALLALSSSPDGIEAPLTLTDIAYVLFYTAGVTKRRVYPGHGEMLFRAAACTGALYHIELYLAVADLPDLAAGVYHFGPIDFALRQLRPGDYRHILVEASGNHPALQDAPAILIGSDTFWRNAWKYRARAYRHSFWDAGTMLANLLAVTTARRLPAQIVMGFADQTVNAVVDLDGTREAALFLVGLGQGITTTTAQTDVGPLNLETAPLSRDEVDYPAIRIMHEASTLRSAEEVEIWRNAVPSRPVAITTGARVPLTPDADDQIVKAGIEAVIRRRGSTRQFAHRPLALTELSNVFVRAVQDIPVDFLGLPGARLNEVYVIVHAVTDLSPGAYVFHPEAVALELLQDGDFRHQAGMLALGQDLAADASVAVFLLCDMPRVLEQFGNRGYRAAQLEAGIIGGRMYLAAYAQGFGATGLTFFDDDVTAFFSPHAAGKSVMFLIALGHAARRRR
jgi:SagB-type dehydrogenase family enzyme